MALLSLSPLELLPLEVWEQIFHCLKLSCPASILSAALSCATFGHLLRGLPLSRQDLLVAYVGSAATGNLAVLQLLADIQFIPDLRHLEEANQAASRGSHLSVLTFLEQRNQLQVDLVLASAGSEKVVQTYRKHVLRSGDWTACAVLVESADTLDWLIRHVFPSVDSARVQPLLAEICSAAAANNNRELLTKALSLSTNSLYSLQLKQMIFEEAALRGNLLLIKRLFDQKWLCPVQVQRRSRNYASEFLFSCSTRQPLCLTEEEVSVMSWLYSTLGIRRKVSNLLPLDGPASWLSLQLQWGYTWLCYCSRAPNNIEYTVQHWSALSLDWSLVVMSDNSELGRALLDAGILPEGYVSQPQRLLEVVRSLSMLKLLFEAGITPATLTLKQIRESVRCVKDVSFFQHWHSQFPFHPHTFHSLERMYLSHAVLRWLFLTFGRAVYRNLSCDVVLLDSALQEGDTSLLSSITAQDWSSYPGMVDGCRLNQNMDRYMRLYFDRRRLDNMTDESFCWLIRSFPTQVRNYLLPKVESLSWHKYPHRLVTLANTFNLDTALLYKRYPILHPFITPIKVNTAIYHQPLVKKDTHACSLPPRTKLRSGRRCRPTEGVPTLPG